MAIRKVVSRSIGTDVIAAEDLAANSVTVAEIQDGAVTTAKLASGAVSSAKLDTNLNVSGTLGVGESSPLGQLHIKTEDTGVSSVSAQGDLLVLEGTETGISILNSTAGAGYINFGDSGDNDIGKIVYDHPTNSLRLFANASQKLRLDSDGLKFNGDSAAANGLNDYETGTYQWTLTGNSGGSYTPRSGYAYGSYEKIGRQVTVRARWETSGAKDATGYMKLSLPFTCENLTDVSEGTCAATFIFRTSAGDLRNPTWVVSAGNAYMILYVNSSTNDVYTLDASNTDSAIEGYFSITYRTNV